MLLPALNKAREAAKTVVCASNLRQWGLVMQQYQQDWQGALAPPTNTGWYWNDIERVYLKTAEHPDYIAYVNNKLFACPDNPPFTYPSGMYDTRQTSYTFNRAVTHYWAADPWPKANQLHRMIVYMLERRTNYPVYSLR
jgi:hypothetical protein